MKPLSYNINEMAKLMPKDTGFDTCKRDTGHSGSLCVNSNDKKSTSLPVLALKIQLNKILK